LLQQWEDAAELEDLKDDVSELKSYILAKGDRGNEVEINLLEQQVQSSRPLGEGVVGSAILDVVSPFLGFAVVLAVFVVVLMVALSSRRRWGHHMIKGDPRYDALQQEHGKQEEGTINI